VQDRKRITALVKEGANAGILQRSAISAALAREVNAGGPPLGQHLGDIDGLARINLVGGTEAGELRARVFELLRQIVTPAFHPLDATSLEKALGEARSRVEI